MRAHLTFLLLPLLMMIQAPGAQSDAGFSYDRMPTGPITDRARAPVPMHRPAARPGGRGQGGSRYLRRKKPGRKNLDKNLLLELMGDDYQESWMSDEKPGGKKRPISVPSNEVDEIPGRWAQERLLEQALELNLTAELAALQPELLKHESAVRTWLLRRSSCPVEFTWRDLGATFWPRWVRNGECLDRKGTCSFPPGMHCVPAATTTVHLLRWQCRDKKTTVVMRRRRSAEAVERRRPVAELRPEQQRRKRRRCDWYRVPFPITIDCYCTC